MREIIEQNSSLNNFNSKFVVSKYGEVLVDCNFTDKDGRTVKKLITLDSYVNLLSSHTVVVKEEAPMVQLGKLPDNLYDGAISSEGKLAAVLTYPAEKRFFKPVNGKGTYIAFPRLVFGLKTDTTGKLVTGYCFALKENQKLEDNSPLFLYPYGNVSHTGSICWGNSLVNAPKLKNFKDLQYVIEMFFSSQTAAHYYQAEVNTTLKISHDNLISEMEKCELFPDKILRPADTNLGDIMKILGC